MLMALEKSGFMLSFFSRLTRQHWVLIALFIVIFDQLSKFLMTCYLLPSTRVELLPGFDLVLRFNTGAAFSLLADGSGWQRWLFIVLAIGMSALLYYCLSKVPPEKPLESLGLTCVLGGAIGNLIDRVLQGYVTDFILLYYRHWEWPAFNIADSAICVGVALLVPTLFRKNI